MYHIFLIYSCIDGYLGCFNVLTIVNNAGIYGFMYLFFFFFLLFCFLGLHLGHVEVPRLAVEWELQLPATATAMPDLGCICNLHHSAQQCWILNSLSKARDPTCMLKDTTQVHYH